MNLGQQNLISWMEKISEDVQELQRNKKDLRRELNDARLEVALLEPEIETQIRVLELGGYEVNYPYFLTQSRSVDADSRFLDNQLRGIQSELVELSQYIISLECKMDIAKGKYTHEE